MILRFKRKKNNVKKWKDYDNVKDMHLRLTLYRNFPVLAEHEVLCTYSPQFYLWWSLFLCGFGIIAAGKPGWVGILLKRPDGRELGETKIKYYDEDDEALKRVIKNPMLQARIFRNHADRLDNTTTVSGGEAQHFGICGEWRTLLITSKFHENYPSTTACVLNRCKWKWTS